MNLVSPIMKQSMLIVCSALCLALAFPTSSFAQSKALATCEKEWSANKAFNQAAGITKRDWLAKCRADLATRPAADVTAAPVSVPLRRSQIKAVCDGNDGCQKACGLDARYTCSFGCEADGCFGQCTNCSSKRVNVRTIQTVVANTKRPWQ